MHRYYEVAAKLLLNENFYAKHWKRFFFFHLIQCDFDINKYLILLWYTLFV